MMMNRTTLCLAVMALLTCATMSSAQQSLADVAKAEEARRKRVKAPSKTYTNESLRTEGEAVPIPAPASAAPAAAKPADATAKPDPSKTEPAEEGPKKDEKYWRGRITAVQQTLARDKVLLDALQSRVNALNTEFANTSDPAQRGVVESNRKTALAEMDRMNKEIAAQTKEVANIQDEARKANVPPGWLR